MKVRLTAKAATREEAEALLAPLAEEVRRRLGDALFTVDDEELEEAVGRLLRAAKQTLACAESLTGGGVGARLTSVAGASEYFVGSAVVYTAEAKRHVLGVRQETIDGPGVVSRECALEMAAGARRVFGADVGLALTGAAGPEPHGGAEPGTVWIALDAGDIRHARKLGVPGERFRVRRWAEQAGLDLVRRYLEGAPASRRGRLRNVGWRRTGRPSRRREPAAVRRHRRASAGRAGGGLGHPAVAPGLPGRPLGAAGELARDPEVPRPDAGVPGAARWGRRCGGSRPRTPRSP